MIVSQDRGGEHVRQARGRAERHAQGQGERQGHVRQIIVQQYPAEQVGGAAGRHVERHLDDGRQPRKARDRGPAASAAGQPAPQERGHVRGQHAPRPRGTRVVHGQAVDVEQRGRGRVTGERRALLLGVVALVQALGGAVRETPRARGRGRRGRRLHVRHGASRFYRVIVMFLKKEKKNEQAAAV